LAVGRGDRGVVGRPIAGSQPDGRSYPPGGMGGPLYFTSVLTALGCADLTKSGFDEMNFKIKMTARSFVVLASVFFLCAPSHGNMTTVVNVTCGVGLHGSTIESCTNLIKEDQRVIKMLTSMKKEKDSSASDQKRFSAEQIYLQRDIAYSYQVIELIKARDSVR
jgi:hypothetical protein